MIALAKFRKVSWVHGVARVEEVNRVRTVLQVYPVEWVLMVRTGGQELVGHQVSLGRLELMVATGSLEALV